MVLFLPTPPAPGRQPELGAGPGARRVQPRSGTGPGAFAVCSPSPTPLPRHLPLQCEPEKRGWPGPAPAQPGRRLAGRRSSCFLPGTLPPCRLGRGGRRPSRSGVPTTGPPDVGCGLDPHLESAPPFLTPCPSPTRTALPQALQPCRVCPAPFLTVVWGWGGFSLRGIHLWLLHVGSFTVSQAGRQ